MIAIKILLSVLIIAVVADKDYCAIWRNINPGDTCWKIVQESQNMKLEYLQKYNPGLNCDKLEVGGKICTARTGFPLPCKQSHKIKGGDTCFKIWTAYGIVEGQIRDWNENLNCDKLQVGKEVCVKR